MDAARMPTLSCANAGVERRKYTACKNTPSAQTDEACKPPFSEAPRHQFEQYVQIVRYFYARTHMINETRTKNKNKMGEGTLKYKHVKGIVHSECLGSC